MEKLIRKIDLTRARGEDASQLLRREWLATNGLGGYASGTICGSVTWRYHGLLIAALPAPFGRMVMLNHLAEYIRFADGRVVEIGGEERSQPQEAEHIGHFITEFRLENHLPVWRYEVEGIVLEKHVLFLYGQNTVHISYRLLSNQEDMCLELRPSMHFRGHDNAVNDKAHDSYRFSVTGEQYEVMTSDTAPRLRMVMKGDRAAFTYDGGTRREIFYQKEADRGYEARGSLWSPGCFSVILHKRRDATLIASTEWWHDARVDARRGA
jgi:predicted glycogen debranching enzyme